MADEFDYVVVGAGSAGSVVARRLTESGLTVCVLEAGTERWPKITAVPAAVLHTVGNRKYDWGYVASADPTRENVVESWPRGLGPGGSSLINGMIFVRGAPEDYDAWRDVGAAGWGYQDVLPYFRRLEHGEGLSDQSRGQLGPQSVTTHYWRHALTEDFMRAAVEAGIQRNEDYNASVQDGVGPTQAIQRRGRRHSAYDAFLKPVLARRNLELRTNARAQRLLFNGRVAVGVEYRRDGEVTSVRARKSVVLCGGAINSPQLLMLSGIGPGEHLNTVGVPLVVDAPSVGKNLMEHATVWLMAEMDQPTLNQETTGYRKAVNLIKWLVNRGPATSPVAQAVAFARIGEGSASPDIQIHFCPFGTTLEASGLKMSGARLISLGATLSHPKSTGEILLKDRDPNSAPIIRPRMLSEASDLESLGRGVRLIERILRQDPLASHLVKFANPPPAAGDAAAFAAFLRSNAKPAYHPVGTCRMGSGADAALDSNLRVKGVRGLFVADASVMPRHISGNTYGAALMIGEKAADLILAEDR